MKIAVIGCGVMGSAFARHFAGHKQTVIVSDHEIAKAQKLAKEIGATLQENPAEAMQTADAVLLAIKPHDLPQLARETSEKMREGKILISILAGTSVEILKRYFPKASIVRTMPNLGLAYGQGVMGIVDSGELSQEVKQKVDALFQGIGLTAWMKEDKIDALTAVSGSGIGFVLLMIEAMIDGGVHLGLTAQESREFVLKTMEGAVALTRGSGKHPAELKLQISSPGGTTIAGLNAMEKEGVRAGIAHGMQVCYEKTLKMKKESEK